MQLITVNNERYLVLSTVSAHKIAPEVTTKDLKKRVYLADTVLKNGDTYYLCMKCIDVEFEELDTYESRNG